MIPPDNASDGVGLVTVYGADRAKKLVEIIEVARAKLAEIDTAFTLEKAKIDFVRARLFAALRPLYERRDGAKLLLGLKRRLIESRRRKAKSEVRLALEDFERATAESKRQYEEAAEQLKPKQLLTAGEEIELQQLWKKLVRLYHPDRFVNEPDKLETYTKLTAGINSAKDSGDIATLREIAKDPLAFIHKRGWAILDFSDGADVTQLERLYRSLLAEIDAASVALRDLRSNPEYELAKVAGIDERAFAAVLEKQKNAVEAQVAEFDREIAAAEAILQETTAGEGTV